MHTSSNLFKVITDHKALFTLVEIVLNKKIHLPILLRLK